MHFSPTEEEYLKSIFNLAEKEKKMVSTNALAHALGTTAASVTDMLKKLAQKELISYQRYSGVSLTLSGSKVAIAVLRRQRLWNTFLISKLRFNWHQVADISDDLEHVISDELVSRLDAFLDYPKFDPFGDPVPNTEGKFSIRHQMALIDVLEHKPTLLLGVRDHNYDFLSHLSNLNIKLGSQITILQKNNFDFSMVVSVDEKYQVVLGKEIAQNLMVKLK